MPYGDGARGLIASYARGFTIDEAGCHETPAGVRLPAGFLRLAPYGRHRAYTWNGATLLLGNSYVIAGAAAIAGTAGYLWITRGRQRDLVAKKLGSQLRAAKSEQLTCRLRRCLGLPS